MARLTFRNAADVPYDNTTSGLTSDDVQAALDELAAAAGSMVDGSGAADQVATWVDSNTLQGDANFTWDGTHLEGGGGFFVNTTTSTVIQGKIERTSTSTGFESAWESLLITGHTANSIAEHRALGAEVRHAVAFDDGAVTAVKAQATTLAGFSAGTVAELNPVRSIVQVSGAGAVTDMFDYKACTPTIGGGAGAIARHVQYFAEDPGAAAYATDKIAFMSEGANTHSRLVGGLTVGADAAPTGSNILDVQGDANVSGKLTVGGLIDPTGLVLALQASTPHTPASGEATLWASNPAFHFDIFGGASITIDQSLALADGVQFDTAVLNAGSNQLGLGPSATRVTVTAVGTALRTLTLPDATDTLVGRDTTDTLTGKTLNTASNTFVLDAGDVTTGTFADARISQSSVTQHQGAIDHGSILGLADDDHTQYVLVDGTRAMTGTLIVNNGAGTNAVYSETGIDRSSGVAETFNIQNSGAGAMTLQVDGVAVSTAGHTHDHGALTGLGDDDHTIYLLAAGTRALTANWDAGSFEIRAQTFQSDVITGTAPFIVASTTLVANLNADLLDSQSGAYYLDSANFTGTDWTDLTDAGETALHTHDHGALNGLADDDHTIYVLVDGTRAMTGTLTVNNGAGTNAVYSETGIDRSSGSAETFNIQNSGAGAMTLQVDGTAVSLVGHTHVLTDVTDVTITAANLNTLDDGADTTLHFHASDRDSANFTGTDWTDLTDAGETALHTHDHGALNGLADDDHPQYAAHGATETIAGAWEKTTTAFRFNTTTLQLDNPAETFQYIFATSAIVADRTVTVPLLTGNDTFVFEDFAATFTNKIIDSANNTLTLDLSEGTLTGTMAEFDTAVSDGNIAYAGGAYHDGFSDFVAAEHTNHTTVTITISGDANEITVAEGAQDISASRTFNVGIADNPTIPGTYMTVPTKADPDPTGADGRIYYNTTSNIWRIAYDTTWRTVANLDQAQTFSNKTIDSANNTLTLDLAEGTLTGTPAQFDTALTGDTFVYTSEVGSVVQAWDADLDTIAGLSSADGNFIVGSAGGWVVESGATARASMSAVGISGTPANNRVATWDSATTIDSDANFTFDGTTLTVATAAGVIQTTGADSTMIADNATMGDYAGDNTWAAWGESTVFASTPAIRQSASGDTTLETAANRTFNIEWGSTIVMEVDTQGAITLSSANPAGDGDDITLNPSNASGTGHGGGLNVNLGAAGGVLLRNAGDLTINAAAGAAGGAASSVIVNDTGAAEVFAVDGSVGGGVRVANDLDVDGGIACGSVTTNPAAGDGIFSNGLVVGFDGAATADRISIGASTTYIERSTGGDIVLNPTSGSEVDFNYPADSQDITPASLGNVPTGVGAVSFDWLRVLVQGSTRYIALWA